MQTSHAYYSIKMIGTLWERLERYSVEPESVSYIRPEPAMFDFENSCGGTAQTSRAVWSMQG